MGLSNLSREAPPQIRLAMVTGKSSVKCSLVISDVKCPQKSPPLLCSSIRFCSDPPTIPYTLWCWSCFVMMDRGCDSPGGAVPEAQKRLQPSVRG